MATYCNTCNQTTTNCNCCSTTTCTPSSIDSTCLVHSGEQGDVIFTDILPKIRREYDLTCLGGTTGTNPFDAIQSILTQVCTAVLPVYDLSCLGGSATDTQQVAISTLITAVCNIPGATTYDLTCLGISANPTGSISTAVSELITTVCTTTVIGTLDWTCLTDPASTDLTVVLQSVLDQSKANKLTVTPSTHLLLDTVSDSCNPVLSFDEAALITTIDNNITYKITPNDLCTKNYLMQGFSVGPGLTLTEKYLDLYLYSFSYIMVPAEWSFNSITLPYGSTYDIPVGIQTDVPAIEAYLLAIGLPIATVSVVGPQLTVTFQAYGNSSSQVATINITPSIAAGPTDINNSYAAPVSGGGECATIHLEFEQSSIDDPCHRVESGEAIEVINRVLNEVTYTWVKPTTTTLDGDFISLIGVTHAIPGAPLVLNAPQVVEDALNAIAGIPGTFTVTLNATLLLTTIQYTVFIDPLSALIPELELGGILTLGSGLTSNPLQTCVEDTISLSLPSVWQNVTYETGWTGDLQYRVNTITDTIEIKGGTLINSNLGTTTDIAILENAFTVPAITNGTTPTYSNKISCILYEDADAAGTEVTSLANRTAASPTAFPQADLLNTSATGVFQISLHRGGQIAIMDGLSGVGSAKFYIPTIVYYI